MAVNGTSGEKPPSAAAESFPVESIEEGLRVMAFGARVPTGTSAKDIVYTKNKTTLYRYRSNNRRHKTPILFCYALINKPYIFDLTPENSFIKFLVDNGYDVFLIDWGTPGWEDREMDYDDYIADHMRACVTRMLRASGADDFTLFGYCMGGTMSGIYAALYPEHLRNLITLTAPFDFAGAGLHGTWTAAEYFDAARLAAAFGNVPGKLIDTGNTMLKPITNTVGAQVMMWDRLLSGKDMTNFFAMSKWVDDGVPFAGAAFVQWITHFYQRNALVKGEIAIQGDRVDLSTITVPLLNIVGDKDHICPPEMAAPLNDLVSSEDKTYLVMHAGHVGLLVGSGAKKGLWPKVLEWLDARSD